MYKLYFSILVLLGLSVRLNAQIIYVSPNTGTDNGDGSATHPIATLPEAVALANSFSTNQSITIKLMPGLYVLNQQLKIKGKNKADTLPCTIEAAVMPDDANWQPAKMPVIQSVSDANAGSPKFPHCVGVEVERGNVAIKGIKFLGNPHPGLEYYYAIQRPDSTLNGLEISQCYFIAEKNSTPMQGAVFAQGSNIHIDHCVFYGCKNDVLVFIGINGFSLTHSIMYGAYEAAFWYGFRQYADVPFTFSDNIVANSNCFFVGDKGVHPTYTFRNALITDNAYYMGINGMTIELPDTINKPTETGIRKTGRVLLNEITANSSPRDYLNLSPASDGRNINAGIFKNSNK